MVGGAVVDGTTVVVVAVAVAVTTAVGDAVDVGAALLLPQPIATEAIKKSPIAVSDLTTIITTYVQRTTFGISKTVKAILADNGGRRGTRTPDIFLVREAL